MSNNAVIQLNAMERAIKFVSPSWACKRESARVGFESLRRFDGASKSKRLEPWMTPATSPQGVTRTSGNILRARMRDLERNNSWYRRAVDLLVNNVVGSGIRPQITTTDKDNTRRDVLQKEFLKWFESRDCDYDGLSNGFGLQRLTKRTRVTSGEVLIRKRYSKEYGLQIQILEPDFIDDTKDGIVLDDGGYIIQGIEYNNKGKRIAYWLYENHPSDYMPGKKYASNRVDAKHVIHFFRAERPGQVRGIPQGSQVVVRLHDLDEFQDAELMKQKIASLLVGFRQKAATQTKPTNQGANENINLFPGTIEDLGPGETMSWSTPPQHQMYPEYVRSILLEIAVVFGLTYEMLSGDLKKTSFSSGRMGWIESSRYFKSDQDDLNNGVLNPVFYWWLEFHGLQTRTKTDGVSCKWVPPHRELIDPAKEIKAWAEAKNENLIPIKRIWTMMGWNPDEVIADIAEMQEKMDEAGIRTGDEKEKSEETENEEDDDEQEDEEKPKK